MSAIEMRDDIYKWAEQVDESFLSAVHAIMGAYVDKQVTKEGPIVGYDAEGKPQYASIVGPIYDERVRAAKEDGAFITLEELKQEAETW